MKGGKLGYLGRIPKKRKGNEERPKWLLVEKVGKSSMKD